MNKIKIIEKQGIKQIMIKSLKGQQLNDHEVYSINNNEVKYLLHFDVIQKKNSFKLFYDITGFITLKKYLKTPLNKELFANMLKNIFDFLVEMKKAFFHKQNVLMDFNNVMVNPSTNSIYFIYVPIQRFDSECSLREFLLNIIQYCSFIHGEDTSYVTEYINILNSGINFSEFELGEYIQKLLNDDRIAKTLVKCPKCQNVMPRGDAYCQQCGTKLTGILDKNIDKKYYTNDPFGDIEIDKNKDLDENLKKVDQHITQNFSEGTIVLSKDAKGTTVLGVSQLKKSCCPFLIRCKNNERVEINCNPFRIGKDKNNNDYAVLDNNAVSRKHAKILTSDGRYYITDLNSTNHTYIDNHIIPSDINSELFNNTTIRLANEDFIFYIETQKGEK